MDAAICKIPGNDPLNRGPPSRPRPTIFDTYASTASVFSYQGGEGRGTREPVSGHRIEVKLDSEPSHLCVMNTCYFGVYKNSIEGAILPAR